ncbi:amino acid adenylation domain-containing protein [Paenibacillus xylanilyticus]|uniref:amino acid adenylation domain-containing protein n=1 Tax=Paenibacillus xylanilyticus TaxID=248903 RepID=UPI0039A30D58
MMNKPEIADIYPLSPMQEALLFHSLYDQGDVYFEQMIFTIEGFVDIKALERSMNKVIERYDTLRTIFIHDKINKPRQIVLRNRNIKLDSLHLTEPDPAEQRKIIRRMAEEDRQRSFDLSKDILLRLQMIQTGPAAYTLIWSNHHILIDGWCLGIIFKEWFSLYKQEIHGTPAQLERVIPYKRYIKWLGKQRETEARTYWKNYLSGYEPGADFPVEMALDSSEPPSIKEITFNLGKVLTEQLMEVSSQYQVTMSSLFQTVWGVVLQYYSNSDDVVFGTVVSGRSAAIPNVEKIVGLFINAVPVRIMSDEKQSFAQLLKETHQNAILSEEYSYLSLAEVQAEAGQNGTLFNHIMVYENYPSSASMFDTKQIELGFDITSIEAYEHTNYDLNISIGPGEEIRVKINYNEQVYSDSFIERLFSHLKQACLLIAGEPEISVADIHILTPEENNMLAKGNETKADYPREQTIPELFTRQARLYPDHPAIQLAQQTWTYAELHALVEDWTIVLQSQGIKPGDRVGLVARKSMEMIAGLLAIIRAGAAYIPLDPTFPAERLTHMLHDSGARSLLRLTEVALPEYEGFIVTRDMLMMNKGFKNQDNHQDCEVLSEPHDAAYIIYTSGSTGKPKGVVATHQNIIKTVLNNGYVELNSNDRILQISNYAFDGATFDIYGALLNGSTLVLTTDEQMQNVSALAEMFAKEEISVAFMTTALFNTMVDWNPNCFSKVRHLLFGGEKASIRHLNKAFAVLGPGRLLHMYGPTETTVYATYYPVTQPDQAPIGKPIHNTTAYVMNSKRNPMPIGVTGQLYIGGEGLASYLNAPELMLERFVDNPLVPGQKMYKTGDLVKRLPDGNLEFVDRKDHQVKIRGHRIELGEVQEKMRTLSAVEDVLVTAWRDAQGNSNLCAYIIPVPYTDAPDEQNQQIQEWKWALKAHLPEYMIPATFQILRVFPLTSNGKIDRKNLPLPETLNQTGNLSLSGETEHKLAQIWKDVLGCKPGAGDHFFEVGGHSLKAMMLVAKIHKELDVKLSLHDVFQAPVLREMAVCIDSSRKSVYKGIPAAERQDSYPVSASQKRVYIAQQLAPLETSYNMPMVLEIEGKLNRDKLESAFIQLIQRHEVLRTRFIWSGEHLRQHILESAELNWKLFDYEMQEQQVEVYLGKDAVDGKKTIIASHLEKFVQPFDLSTGPLIRAALAQVASDRSLLFIDIHHIVSDGVSTGIIYKELTQLYEGEELSPVNLHYKDYSVYEQNERSSQRYEDNRNYWCAEFEGDLPSSEIVPDYIRPSVRSYEGNSISFQLGTDLTDRLRSLAAQHNTTLYVILLAAYNIMLSKYTGEEDIVVGSPTAGRYYEDVHSMVGMFVNTLALRNQVPGELTVDEFIRRVKSRFVEAQEHGEFPLEDLLEHLQLSRDLSRHPLFDTLFVLQNMDIPPIQLTGITFTAAEWDWNHAKFDMTWGAQEGRHGMNWTVEYASSIYKKSTILRMIDHYKTLLVQMVDAHFMKLKEIHLLTNDEQSTMLSCNETQAQYPRQASIPLVLEQQAVQTPDQIAVIDEDQSLTYREFNEVTNQYARVLMEKGMKQGDIVGLLTDRSLGMIIAIFGILKTGAMYIPMDPSFPEERKRFIVEDSNANWLITGNALTIAECAARHLELEAILQEAANAQEQMRDWRLPAIPPEATAYMMYTSGSTGKPKGVMTSHRNIVKTSIHNGFGDLSPSDRVLQVSNYAFDGSTYEIYGALLNGASLLLIAKNTLLDAAELARTMDEQRITSAFMTTTLFNTMVDYDITCFRHVRKLFFGGESASIKHVLKALDYLGEHRIVNGYGPTETTVFAATYSVENSLRQYDRVPIGRPIHNTRLYVLNRWNQLQPVGVPGELYIGGEGVSKGYLNQPGLTEERFVPDPYVPGETIYRTGDLVVWREDGQLEYLARMDNQVKIRGNRIELGEIETRLKAISSVNEAVLLARKEERGEGLCLCAYVVPNDSALKRVDSSELTSEWKNELRQVLPEYMIPAFILVVDTIPMTSNGKVDHAVLPMPAAMGNADEVIQPENLYEEQLQHIWSEVLGQGHPGMLESFLDLGGHSLKAMTMVAKIHQIFDVKLSLQDIFSHPTIREQAKLIQGNDKLHRHIPLPSVNQGTSYSVSSAQRRLYIIQQNEHIGTSYNMPMVLRIEGHLNIDQLENALLRLIERHESLRTSFLMEEEEVRQRVHVLSELDWKLQITEVNNGTSEYGAVDQDEEAWVASCIYPFDMSAPSLFRAFVRRQSDTEHLLLLDVHHIVSDGISTAIMYDELFRIYDNEELPILNKQYKEYAAYEQLQQSTETYSAARDYWHKLYEGEVPILDFPLENVRPRVQRYEGAQHTFLLGNVLAKRVTDLAASQDTTVYVMLLAAYYILLSKYSGQEDIVVGTPVAGRDHAETAAIVGMFVKTLPLRSEIKPDLTVAGYMASLKQRVLNCSNHALYPLEELLDHLQIVREPSRHPLFETLFVLQNMNTAQLKANQLNISQMGTPTGRSKFEMTWAGHEMNEGISMTVEYNTDLFSHERIQQLSSHYTHILEQMTSNPNLSINDMELCTAEEILYFKKLEGQIVEYPRELSIPERFEEQVRQHGDRSAVILGSMSMTYSELGMNVNRMAAMLRQEGVRPGDRVGLLTDRSMGMIVSILGILKSGATYVPLDPGFPQERLAYMLEDSQVRLLMAEQGRDVPGFPGKTVVLNEQCWTGSVRAEFVGNPVAQPDNAAYVMYTSGSTGKPKGVVTTHRNIMKTSIKNGFNDMMPTDRVLQLSNYAFDGSTYDIFGALLNGSALILISREDMLHITELARTLDEQRITTVFMTTALFNTLVDFDLSCLKHVRRLFFGGEPGSRKHVLKALDYLGPHRIINCYGPTETTVFATTFSVDESMRDRSNVPIGCPVHNTQVYVLNPWGKRQPIGVPGELYIGGEGLALGYLNQPALTEERFGKNPLKSGTRLYRTGDLVKWLPDGNLEFLDRLDQQVKIRGNRVELTEVESRLLVLPEVKEAMVTSGRDEQGHSFLSAYIVPHSTSEPRLAGIIREQLLHDLPDYMVPSTYTLLDSFPLTSNGKVDKRMLPNPQPLLTESYVAPTNPLEAELAEIWTNVLGLSRVGIHDHFFELGGHSLKAMSLIAQIHKAFDVKFTVQDVFTYTSVLDQSKFIQKARGTHRYASLQPVTVQDTYPASSAQKRLFFLQHMDQQSTSYNMPMIFEIEGELSAERLEEAFISLIHRHESLRTSFELVQEDLRQRIWPAADLEWRMERTLAERKEPATADTKTYVHSFIRPFNLRDHKSLIRAGLLSTSANKHILVVDTHHIVSDGTSTGIIFSELFQLYEQQKFEPLPVQYKEYAVWEQEQKNAESYRSSGEYWLNQFQGELSVLNLPYDNSYGRTDRATGARVEMQLGAELTEQLQKQAEENKTTLYTVMMAGYSILLSKYAGQEDIIIGVPTAGREHADIASVVGMFVNTLALRLRPEGEIEVERYIQQVHTQLLQGYEHGMYALEELIEQLALPRALNRHPLFDTMFVLQNMEHSSPEASSISIRQMPSGSSEPKFDMTWGSVEHAGGLSLTVEYNENLFSSETIERMMHHYKHILQQMVIRPYEQIMKIEMCTPEERLHLASLEGEIVDYPREETISQRFEKQVLQYGDRPSVVMGTEEITYGELEMRANLLAEILRLKGIASGGVVGLLANRSIGMIVSIMGILKVGAVYVPLDPTFPEDRLAYMLRDSQAQLLISEVNLGVPDFQGQTILLDERLWGEVAKEEVVSDRLQTWTADSPAYVMYTSGSTGAPKGVVTTHRNIMRTSVNNGFMDMGPEDRVLQLSNYAFDGSTYEIFGALLNGAVLVLIPREDVVHTAELARTLKEERISSAFMTAALFNTLVDYDVTSLTHVRKLFFGGEAASRSHVLKALDYLGPHRLANGYGPTETTVFAATYTVDETLRDRRNVPIGRPVHNTKVYVLNRWGQRQPIGVPGELYVGGDGLALGYLNQPAQTAERFIESVITPGEIIYRTGDLVRWLPDGNLEYLDRLDQQVKIRGNRIELPEIEDHLISLPEVREAVVVPKRDKQGHSYLVAYVVLQWEEQAAQEQLAHIRQELSSILPQYMIPSRFEFLNNLPRNSNGKIDRRALPEPVNQLTSGYCAPENALEQDLALIWAEVLGIERAGTEDHFFEHGGHSLKAMMLNTLIQEQLHIRIDLQDVFKYPTIKLLAAYIQQQGAALYHDEYEPIQPALEQSTYPATPYQAYGYEASEDNNHWNMPMAFHIKGRLQAKRLENSFRALIERHEALRTSLHNEGGQVVQRIHQRTPFDLIQENVESELDRIRIMESFIQPFNAARPPLLRAKLLHMGEEDHVLLMDMHHAISDGTSVGILMHELIQLYQGITLPLVQLQYKDYAVWQKDRLDRGGYAESQIFWKEVLRGYQPFTVSSERVSDKDIISYVGDQIVVKLPASHLVQIREKLHDSSLTDYAILFSVYLLTLHQKMERTDLIVGTYAFGRRRPELQDTVGLFINSIPLRNIISTGDTYNEYLLKLQANQIRAFEHQEYPYEKMLKDAGFSSAPDGDLLFDTMFNLNNFADRSVEISDIQVSPFTYEWKFSEYEIYVTAQKVGEHFSIHFDYRVASFSREEMERFTDQYLRLFEHIVEKPYILIDQLNHMNPWKGSVIH